MSTVNSWYILFTRIICFFKNLFAKPVMVVVPRYRVLKRINGKKYHVRRTFRSVTNAKQFGETLGCKFVIKQEFTLIKTGKYSV